MINKSPTILIVDDEASVRRLLRRALEKESFHVLEAQNGAEVMQLVQSEPIDLITLDLSLGGENGLELAREIRRVADLGIIIVSGKGELIDTVLGLELGADDYITKPFQIRDVIARVRAVLRRYATSQPKTENHPAAMAAASTKVSGYTFNNWTLDTDVRELRDADQNICELTTGEYELLHLLIRRARQVLSRDQIMDEIKGNEWAPNDRTIDNQIARLRKKLNVGDDQPPIIKTIRGAGYMFTAKVK